jgi:hypothetical protein
MEKQANELGQELIDLRQSAVPDSWADDLSIPNYTSCGKNSSVFPHTRSSGQATKKKSKLSVWAGSEIQKRRRGSSTIARALVSVSAVKKSLIRFKPSQDQTHVIDPTESPLLNIF